MILLVGMAMQGAFIHYNGRVYRKRIAAALLYAAFGSALAAFTPAKDQRWKYGRYAYPLAAIIAGGSAFQHITCSGYITMIELEFLLQVLLLCAVIYVFVWLFVPDSRIASIVFYWLMCLMGYAYECVTVFRGVSFKPMDILSIGTAMSVVGNYQFPLTPKHLVWCMTGVIFCILAGYIPPRKVKKKIAKAAKLVATCLAAAWVWILISSDLLIQWNIVSTAFESDVAHFNRKQGTLLTLMKECSLLTRIRPDDYSADIPMNTAISEQSTNQRMSATIRPNVLVIMSESMADLSAIWQIPQQNDPLAYTHSLTENTIHGNLVVSSYGGATSNTEHSFLTSTIPVPDVNIPLFSTVTQNTPSLAWQLRAHGYSTYAMHPYYATNYQRDTIYPKLGFEHFYSMDDFDGAKTLHGYISDAGCYEKIISIYEQKDPEKPMFLFTITMQNHGGYSGNVAAEKEFFTAHKDDQQLRNYAALLHESDQALHILIDYFSQQREPVVLLLFGDHQPNLDLSSYPLQEDLLPFQTQLAQYITPFLIWANYRLNLTL